MGSVTDPTYIGSGVPIEVTVSNAHADKGLNSCGVEFRLQCVCRTSCVLQWYKSNRNTETKIVE